MHIHDSRLTCEECGNTGHSGSNCSKIQEDVNFVNNNYFRSQWNQGWNQQQRVNYQGNPQGNNFNNFNQPPMRELISGQAKILETVVVAKEITAGTAEPPQSSLSLGGGGGLAAEPAG